MAEKLKETGYRPRATVEKARGEDKEKTMGKKREIGRE